MLIAVVLSLIFIGLMLFVYKLFMKKIEEKDRKVIIFGFLFFLIALLPFLGLGNMTPRYSYLSSVGFIILLAIFMKKIYFYLLETGGKYIGTAVVIVLVITYLMVQTFELQKIHTDWKTAGNETQRFLISLEQYSQNYWISQKMQFYFVDVPIKRGEAWIWPVGLKDAIWFTFKNPNLAVYTSSDLNSAFNQAGNSANAHVFKFDNDGNVDEVLRTKTGQVRLLNPPR
jgi:hypothetical protein